MCVILLCVWLFNVKNYVVQLQLGILFLLFNFDSTTGDYKPELETDVMSEFEWFDGRKRKCGISEISKTIEVVSLEYSNPYIYIYVGKIHSKLYIYEL